MEFYSYFPSVTFEVLTADEFVGRDGLLEQQNKDSLVCRRNRIFPLILRVIIKITISSLVIGIKKSYSTLIRLLSCYRTVCFWIVCYWTVCYRTVQ